MKLQRDGDETRNEQPKEFGDIVGQDSLTRFDNKKKKKRKRNEPREDDLVLDESFNVLMDLIRMTDGSNLPEEKGWWWY